MSGTVTVAANASDNVGVTRVELCVDGALTGTDTSSPYQISWNTTTASNGGHALQTQGLRRRRERRLERDGERHREQRDAVAAS